MIALPLHGVGEPRPALPTIAAIFEHAVATAPDAMAFRHRDRVFTWGQAGHAARVLAHRIAGIAEPGQPVALLLANSVEWQIAYFAALRAVTPPALLNPAYPAPQLAPLLREAAPRAILCEPAMADAARALAAEHGLAEVIPVDPGALLAAPAAPLHRRAPTSDDVAALFFSGGTTGTPKAVEHTHGRLVIAARCIEYNWPTRMTGEVWLPIAPFTHIYGWLLGVLGPVASRGEVVIPDRFKPELVVELMARHRVTVFGGGPPAIYAGVLAAANLASADLSALRVCPAGGAPVPLDLHERWHRATGLRIHEGYGMTEMAPIAGNTPLTGIRPGSVGKPMPCAEVEVVDLDTGTRPLPPGERGEIRLRGPHMMAGYRNRPAETAAALRDGFIMTGDIGHFDADGFLFITDRRKDVVLVKGFNVFPREVEEVLHAHPGIAAAGVVGVPDDRQGEKLVAHVVARESVALDTAEIADFLGQRLVAYQIPADIRLVQSLPVTPAQKLDRMALRKLAAGSVPPR